MKIEPGQAKAVFLHAVEHCAPGEWDAYVNQACGENAELRRRVMILLEAHQTADSLIDPQEPTATFGAGSPDPGQPGTAIGPYKLIQQIGEGGMGTVYMAQQTEPVKRTVAVKIIKAGMDTRQVIARFEAELPGLAAHGPPEYRESARCGNNRCRSRWREPRETLLRHGTRQGRLDHQVLR